MHIVDSVVYAVSFLLHNIKKKKRPPIHLFRNNRTSREDGVDTSSLELYVLACLHVCLSCAPFWNVLHKCFGFPKLASRIMPHIEPMHAILHPSLLHCAVWFPSFVNGMVRYIRMPIFYCYGEEQDRTWRMQDRLAKVA